MRELLRQCQEAIEVGERRDAEGLPGIPSIRPGRFLILEDSNGVRYEGTAESDLRKGETFHLQTSDGNQAFQIEHVSLDMRGFYVIRGTHDDGEEVALTYSAEAIGLILTGRAFREWVSHASSKTRKGVSAVLSYFSSNEKKSDVEQSASEKV